VGAPTVDAWLQGPAYYQAESAREKENFLAAFQTAIEAYQVRNTRFVHPVELIVSLLRTGCLAVWLYGLLGGDGGRGCGGRAVVDELLCVSVCVCVCVCVQGEERDVR
jgi:hypothetical protein